MTKYVTARSQLPDLVTQIEALLVLPPLQRATRARALSSQARTLLGRVGDEAISEAVYAPSADNPDRIVGQIAVAKRLGLAGPTVNNACVKYRAWLDAQGEKVKP